MSIEVIQVETDCVHVNDKEIRRDMNGNWVTQEELLPSEQTAFNQWLKSIGE